MSVCEIPDDFGGGKTKHEFSEINPNNSFDRNCWMFDVQIRRERLKVLVEVEQPEGKAGGLQVHRLPK